MTAWFGASSSNPLQAKPVFGDNDLALIIREIPAKNQELLKSSNANSLITQARLLDEFRSLIDTQNGRLGVQTVATELDVDPKDLVKLMERAGDWLILADGKSIVTRNEQLRVLHQLKESSSTAFLSVEDSAKAHSLPPESILAIVNLSEKDDAIRILQLDEAYLYQPVLLDTLKLTLLHSAKEASASATIKSWSKDSFRGLSLQAFETVLKDSIGQPQISVKGDIQTDHRRDRIQFTPLTYVNQARNNLLSDLKSGARTYYRASSRVDDMFTALETPEAVLGFINENANHGSSNECAILIISPFAVSRTSIVDRASKVAQSLMNSGSVSVEVGSRICFGEQF
jgi:hypothetical protein